MGDSDDEHDRRRGRDKFRRERSDYQDRRDDRNRRDDWPERDSWSSRDRSRRGGYREDYPRNRRGDRYSPVRHDLSPPVKRMRRDWDPEQGLTQPPMMTFKQFLASQDDAIDDQEAVKKYNEYKIEFRRQQLNEFFVNHKEEEWFKSKYHPEECGKKTSDQETSMQRRLDVFLKLMEKGWIDSVSGDVEKSDQIVRLLDAVVILLEGGNELDLKVLDEPYEEEKPKELELFPLGGNEEKEQQSKNIQKDPAASAEIPVSPNQELSKSKDDHSENKEEEDSNKSHKKPRRKHVRDYIFDENDEEDDDDDESSLESESELEPGPPGLDEDADSGIPGEESGNEAVKKKKKRKKIKEEKVYSDDNLQRSEEEDDEKRVSDEPKEESPDISKDETRDEKLETSKEEEKSEKMEEADIEEKEPEKEEEDNPKPRPLHKTCSIFLRNLAPSITKQEVEAMCKRYPGFLRVAIADPQPERRFFRRGWVTFERTVNIKEICWNLNNIRLRDCELGAIVNRDLSRRIRSVNGIVSHKQVVRSDIKLAARIIQNLDLQRHLWIGSDKKPEDQIAESFGLTSKNPLLKNITDYLIEEASAEEEELLGLQDSSETKNTEDNGMTLERDETLIKVLDRLLFYLRIVHSLDYYNHSEYSCEDEMPNRCGIMHARGSPPSSRVTHQEIADYINHFEQKIAVFLQPCAKITEEEAIRLGKKDSGIEVEKFLQSNTQELAKDKWLCPLSGKKFKSPEFVRKHIFNKHSEKIDEVRKEVNYFNNYLTDPKRPQLPEHPANRNNGGYTPKGDGMMGPFHSGFPPPMAFGRGMSPNFPGFGGRNFPDAYRAGFKRNSYGRRSPRGEPRKLVTYRDLDAPTDIDFM